MWGGRGRPSAPRTVPGTLGSLAELADAAFDGGLDGREQCRAGRVGLLVVLHRGEEVGLRHAGDDAEFGHGGHVRVAQPAVPGVEVRAVLGADVRLDRAHHVAEFGGVGHGGRRVPGGALGPGAVRGERVRQARVEVDVREVDEPGAGQRLVELRGADVDGGAQADVQPVRGCGERHVDVDPDRVLPGALVVGEQLRVPDPFEGLLVEDLLRGAAVPAREP